MATKHTGYFYKGLQAGLARLLGSAHFIFRVERSVPDSSHAGSELRLDDYSLATRLSFLMWNAPPDAELLARRRDGRVAHSRWAEQASRSADRLRRSSSKACARSSPTCSGIEQFEGLSKDQTIYPNIHLSTCQGRARTDAADDRRPSGHSARRLPRSVHHEEDLHEPEPRLACTGSRSMSRPDSMVGSHTLCRSTIQRARHPHACRIS